MAQTRRTKAHAKQTNGGDDTELLFLSVNNLTQAVESLDATMESLEAAVTALTNELRACRSKPKA